MLSPAVGATLSSSTLNLANTIMGGEFNTDLGDNHITTRVLQLVLELCAKGIHVTKRDLFYADVKLFEKQGHLYGGHVTALFPTARNGRLGKVCGAQETREP